MENKERPEIASAILMIVAVFLFAIGLLSTIYGIPSTPDGNLRDIGIGLEHQIIAIGLIVIEKK